MYGSAGYHLLKNVLANYDPFTNNDEEPGHSRIPTSQLSQE